MKITTRITRCAIHFLSELDAGWLTVVKIRKEDTWTRVATERNADWYREFCRRFERSRGRYRRPRTIIKRYLTRAALEHIASGRCETLYAGRLVEFMRHWLTVNKLEPETAVCAARYDDTPF